MMLYLDILKHSSSKGYIAMYALNNAVYIYHLA